MPIYRVKPGQVATGVIIGLLSPGGEATGIGQPAPPGDIGNPATFDFPVYRLPLPDVSVGVLLSEGPQGYVAPIIEGARRLERMGVAGITSTCGYFGQYQREVAASVSVPVFLSSWLQVPFIRQVIRPEQKILALVADDRYVRAQILQACGIESNNGLVIAGLQDRSKTPAFAAGILYEEGMLDSDRIEVEIVSVVRERLTLEPDIGAILVECSALPAYSAAIQEAVGLPVFDYVTMIKHMYGVLAQRRYGGPMHWSKVRGS